MVGIPLVARHGLWLLTSWTGGWKPVAMRAPALTFLLVTTIALAVVVEFLAQKSSKQGGLALSTSEHDIPQSALFGHLYGTTIVAVTYSLLWTWIDLDIRRLQPWLELSRPDGCTAEDSLLLDYPFQFLAFIPFSAAKRRYVGAQAETIMPELHSDTL